MEFSEQVLVLHVGKFREADLWLRLLSPSRGIISAFAFGGSRSKQRFVGCLDVFNHVLFRVKATPRSGYLALQEGVLIKGLSRLRCDWSRLGIASNCAKFLQTFGAGPEEADKAYALFVSILDVLEQEESLPALLPFFFRSRLAFDHGYALETSCCGTCFNPFENDRAIMFIQEGILLCPQCAQYQAGSRISLGSEALHVLQAVHHGSPSSWKDITLSATAKNECARAIDGFIQYHVGLSWDYGRFTRV